MTYTLSILRHERGREHGFWQDFTYEPASSGDTVATALTAINARSPLLDASGNPARPVTWECSCLQKKCGACAMVIGGRPQLACNARLSGQKGSTIRVEPLRKFPVVEDLMVDRTILYENLKTIGLWLREDADLVDRDRALAYEASGCIQCGCCLEVCPNFYAGGSFYGMAAVPVTTRLLTEMDRKACHDMICQYAKHFYAGCGKSLACRDVCPRGIDTEKMLVNANALAIWKKKRGN